MRKTLFALVVLCGVAPLALAQSLLNEIQERGTLVCGANTSSPGMGSLNADGEFEGFDIDLCRAVAAAVLGDAGAVEFRALTSQDRFTAVQTGEVDVLIRNTTWTSSRDSSVGLNFTQTTFYDGQGFMVRTDSGIDTIADFEGRSVCVSPGTTTELNLADTMEALGIQYDAIIIENADQIITSYDDGACDAYTTDRSGLVGARTRLRDPSAHKILDVTISKEPLGPSVLHGDDAWFDAVKWIVFGLISAEEMGITSENVVEVAATSQDPNVQRMLGVEGDNITGLGLPADAILQAIVQMGNYGEIYERNLGPDTPFNIARGLNAQWYEGGLMYSPPFR